MYGQIHCVIRELVQTKFGNEAWETILRKSELDELDSFLVFTRYDDVSTFNLVNAVSDTLGVPVEAVLEIFGEFFFDYCLRHGYDKMLRTLGSDIKSFIQNLDSLHSLLALSYKGISAPSFRCEDGEDGELILHYYSGRPGLYPIVKGVLKAVARDLFDQSVEMTIIEQNKEDIGCNQSQEHTAFRVLLRTESKTSTRITPEGGNTCIRGLIEFNPDKVLLRATDFCSAFPYHIIFDRELTIRQCGDLVQKHSSVAVTEGMPLTKAFSIVHPRMVVSIENIRKFINAVFLLAISPSDNGKKTFLLKGQMIWLPDTQNMIFIGSPRLTSLNELLEMNVYLADIPLYDVTRELVLLNQQRIAEIDIAKKLDETTAELKRTSQALEVEKSKTETLLHQMLPRNVAQALTHGQKVEAEKFDQVTILFSDIVTFTNIASACSPMDIVNMLNEMYQRFDERTSQHNVYKVETIGDAYMIVSGVPERTANHAQPVANFAMDMVEDAGLVRSPATGLPLQIRVGIHTGPVVAGVVGVKMPRYCLFGDTVNTASRMESHGLPGRIHLSPTVYQSLRGFGYVFKRRGQMEVKGKGQMSTYFLCGHLDRCLYEPHDEFNELEVYCDSNGNSNNAEQSEVCHDNSYVISKMPNEDNYVPTDVTIQNSKDSDGQDAKQFSANSSEEANQKRGHHMIDSSQNLSRVYNQNQTANKSKSQSSNNCFRRLQDIPLQDDTSDVSRNKATKTSVTVTHSGTQTSTEPNSNADSVYISDSSEKEHTEKNSVGSQMRSEPSFLISRSKQRPHKLGLCNKEHSTPNISHELVCDNVVTKETQAQHQSKKSHCADGLEDSNMHEVKSRRKKTTLKFSSASLDSSLHCTSMPKSETFPQPSSYSPLHEPIPSSGSQGNFETHKADTRSKRGKKHHSKLCIVA